MCEDDGRWLSNIAKPDYEIPVCIQIVLMTELFYICFFVVILDFCAYKSSKKKKQNVQQHDAQFRQKQS